MEFLTLRATSIECENRWRKTLWSGKKLKELNVCTLYSVHVLCELIGTSFISMRI